MERVFKNSHYNGVYVSELQVGQPEKFPKIVHELFFAPNVQCSI